MKKIDFLNKINELILAVKKDSQVYVKLKELYEISVEDESCFSVESNNVYELLINKKYDVSRISTERITATQLCRALGLPETAQNKTGAARALRKLTGHESFRSNGVIYNRLPFNRDGTLDR